MRGGGRAEMGLLRDLEPHKHRYEHDKALHQGVYTHDRTDATEKEEKQSTCAGGQVYRWRC